VEFAKGLAAGFVIGVAIIGTAVATLYVHDDSEHVRNAARIEQLDAHVQRLERALGVLSMRVAGEMPVNSVPAATPAALTVVSSPHREADDTR
jgi:hypothetical protein